MKGRVNREHVRQRIALIVQEIVYPLHLNWDALQGFKGATRGASNDAQVFSRYCVLGFTLITPDLRRSEPSRSSIGSVSRQYLLRELGNLYRVLLAGQLARVVGDVFGDVDRWWLVELVHKFGDGQRIY